MSNIKITTDSTADLDYLFNELNIPVMPLSITLEGNEYRDGIDINPAKIFETYETKKVLPKTAAVNPDEYAEFFRAQKPENGSLIHFACSGDLSLSYSNASNAAKEIENVFIIDSRTLSTGMGLLVLKALDFAKGGMAVEEIVNMINQLAPHTQTSFIVNNLEFLHKGGRCSGLQLILAGILKIRPVLQLIGGKIIPARKYKFTNFKKSIQRYIEETLAQYNTPDYSRIFITHSFVEDELVEEAKALIKQLAPDFKEILITTAGSAVTTHCGKGTLGILYINSAL